MKINKRYTDRTVCRGVKEGEHIRATIYALTGSTVVSWRGESSRVRYQKRFMVDTLRNC